MRIIIFFHTVKDKLLFQPEESTNFEIYKIEIIKKEQTYSCVNNLYITFSHNFRFFKFLTDRFNNLVLKCLKDFRKMPLPLLLFFQSMWIIICTLLMIGGEAFIWSYLIISYFIEINTEKNGNKEIGNNYWNFCKKMNEWFFPTDRQICNDY